MGKSIMSKAVVFGTFAPMHRGHIDLIQRAKRTHDSVIVIVSGTEFDRGALIGLTLQKRFRYIRETFRDDKLVEVYKLDESHIPSMPDGWAVWLKMLHQVSNTTKDDDLVFYVSEQEYRDELEQRGYKSHFTERNFGISATLIRKNPEKYWNAIARPFRRHFSKNVLIVGSASNGKTTLAMDLGRYYSSPVSFEYSRHYQSKYNINDNELDQKDFTNILTGQYKQTQNHIEGNENRGLVIADTNSTVTKAYYDYFINTEDDAPFNELFKLTVANEKWDLIIFILPTGEYVNDGYRNMDMADTTIRDQFTNHLKDMMTTYHKDVPTHYIGGDYLTNYQESIKLIDEIYNEY